MPAKKKTTSTDNSDTKRPAKSAKSKSASPANARKTAPKAKPDDAPAPDAANNAAAAEGSPKTKPTASELLKRTRHHTPSIFKVSTRKHAPIVFSLEDVREILKKRKAEDAEEERIEKAAAAKEAPKTGSAAAAAAAAAAAPAQKSKHGAASLADILGFGTGAPAAAKAPGGLSEQDVPAEHRPYYGLLIELRDHVRESLGMHAEDTLKRSQKEDSGDISTSSDAGTDNFDRDFALSVVSSEQEALREIDAAIKRVHNGTYGVCEITGEKISPERLEAVPFTRFSLEGQRQYESTARRRVNRGGGAFLNETGADISFGDDDGDN